MFIITEESQDVHSDLDLNQIKNLLTFAYKMFTSSDESQMLYFFFLWPILFDEVFD